MYANETIQINPTDVVLDTCILMDILFAERPRHVRATELATVLAASACQILIPAHFYFELVSACRSELLQRGAPLTLVGKRSELFPPSWVTVSIDLSFANEYLINSLNAGQLIETKGSDMIFVAVALRHKITLISEDVKLLAAAQKLGVHALNTEDYLDFILKPKTQP